METEKYIHFSQERIYKDIRTLEFLLKNNDYSYLKWYGFHLDDEKKQIIISLGDISEENIARFKAQVMDSPYLRFEKANPFRFD